jgi:hypothetical protein
VTGKKVSMQGIICWAQGCTLGAFGALWIVWAHSSCSYVYSINKKINKF